MNPFVFKVDQKILGFPGFIRNTFNLSGFTWIHPSSQPAAMDGHQRGKKPMLEALPRVPQKYDIPWFQRGSIGSFVFV